MAFCGSGTSAGLYRFVGNRFETVIPLAYISRIEESADGTYSSLAARDLLSWMERASCRILGYRIN